MIVEAIIFSLINQLLFQVILWRLPSVWIVRTDAQALLFLQVLVLPAVIGLILGLNLSRGWNNAVLRRLSMPVSQPVHRAHDFAFAHDRSAGLIILTHFDGTVVFGYFGEQSLAANDNNRSDIYLERLYDVDKEGQWADMKPPRSALLSLEGVRSVEFLEEEGEHG